MRFALFVFLKPIPCYATTVTTVKNHSAEDKAIIKGLSHQTRQKMFQLILKLKNQILMLSTD